MSNKFTTTQIQEKFSSLPRDMQNAIASPETAALIQSIGAKHELRIDAIGVLIEYSGLMMLGMIDSDTFVNTIAGEAGIDREKAANIVLDIDTQVFSRVRNSIKQVQYQATSDKRFETADDFAQAPAPSQTPTVDDILPGGDIATPQLDQQISSDIPMASGDYDPTNFGAQPTPTEAPVQSQENSQGISPVSTTAPSALDQAQDVLENNAFVHGHSASDPVEIQLNTSPAETHMQNGFNSTETERQVNKSIAQGVTKGMPQAVKDAYTMGQAAAPAPSVQVDEIKDFQTKLEEKMAQVDTSSQNADPYKESI